MKATTFPHVEKLSRNFRFENLMPGDPRIEDAVEKYRQDFHLPPTAKPSAAYWLGVFDKDELLAVCGERFLDEDVIEVTDLYPLPGKGRKGTAAIYMALSVLRGALARGVYRQMVATCLYSNKTFQKAIDRIFGCEPTALHYSLEARIP
jgi:hypothetical protein